MELFLLCPLLTYASPTSLINQSNQKDVLSVDTSIEDGCCTSSMLLV